MGKDGTPPEGRTKSTGEGYRVRIPGFISDEEVGLGTALKRVTATVGVKPCGGCERRAVALNRWLVFSGRPRR